MLIRMTFAAVVISLAIATWTSPCSAQSSKSDYRASTATKRQAFGSRSENEASRDVLLHLRAMRDCWTDPYLIVTPDDSRLEDDGLYIRCGSEYALRFAELQDAVVHALKLISDQKLKTQIVGATEVFNDLDTLHRLFNSRAYFFKSVVTVSDIFPIIRKYSIPYQENRISKVVVYKWVVPSRRTYIDDLAARIGMSPRDTNPTLTPTQISVAIDDLDWSVTERQKGGYDWYLRRHPQGRHVTEARYLIDHKDEIQQEEQKRQSQVRQELLEVTRQVFEAYIRADKATLEQLLANTFPSRPLYIERLKSQPEVLSFEIKDFQVQFVLYLQAYRAQAKIQYLSVLKEQRELPYTITYAKSAQGWQVVDWRSP